MPQTNYLPEAFWLRLCLTLMRTPVVKRQTLPKSGFPNFFSAVLGLTSSSSGNVF